MSNYAPDASGYKVPEYNPMGDSANAYAGTVTPGAVSNQVASSAPAGGGNNPYADILKYLPPKQPPLTAKASASDAPLYPSDGTPPATNPSLPPVPPAATPSLTGPLVPTTPSGETPPPLRTPAAAPPAPTTITDAPPVVGPSTTPGWSAENPPPRPSDQAMADPETAANYYRQLAYQNPLFANITGADVNSQRNLAVSGQFAAMGHPEYQDFSTWFLAGKPMPPAAGQPPAGPAGPTTLTNPNAWANSPWGTSNLPPTVSGTGGPAPAGGTPPAAASPPGTDPSGYAGILSQLQQLMSGQNNYAATQLQRRMNGQAATLGDMNSGGYAQVSNAAQAQLAGDQSAKMSDYLNTDWQNQLSLAMQKYGIDTGASTSLSNAQTAAGATMGAAGASAGASRYATDAALQEAMIRDQTARYQGDQSYNLGLAGLGLDQYKFDNPSINALLGYYMQMSPEQLAQFAANPSLFPGQAYTPNPVKSP